jgi:hypothetical protein
MPLPVQNTIHSLLFYSLNACLPINSFTTKCSVLEPESYVAEYLGYPMGFNINEFKGKLPVGFQMSKDSKKGR